MGFSRALHLLLILPCKFPMHIDCASADMSHSPYRNVQTQAQTGAIASYTGEWPAQQSHEACSDGACQGDAL